MMKLNEVSPDFKQLKTAWWERAREMTLAELPTFLESLCAYEHDYGTIVHATAVGMYATMRAIDKTPTGGLTGAQASFVMWELIPKLIVAEDGPMKLVHFAHMLYPQYEFDFTNRVLRSSTWKWLQERAAELLKDLPGAHPDVRAHWKSIVTGTVPFGWAAEQEYNEESGQ